MHHAISFQSKLNDFLICTPRKKSLKHQLICVKQGLVLVKLGKLEYAVEAGQSFWLPFDTLTSLTYTPNTIVSSVGVSSRVVAPFPKQGGYIQAEELLSALLNRLEIHNGHHERQVDLLKVVQSELTTLKPELKETRYTKQINQWQADKESSLSNELKLVLRVREANKQMQSGKKRPMVVESLFDGNDALLVSLEQTILGRELT
ncbi:AraC family transcriptional regulator [Vibrio europaeus]|uniref:AraC family transcriptional regulator n=1 Tax=Vibrio europaeus TaxID=300876 RepID=UPI00233F53FD|nr:AraC family transcriptional regulator [Vibrio europaeus]MDC5818396.1 AraC family transcriptional regulator [Vibrio europaeus]MDC5871601.1 AraC family transcriptional regulator [Vibrio europaeus]